MLTNRNKQIGLSVLLIITILFTIYLIYTVNQLQALNDNLHSKQVVLSENLTNLNKLNNESNQIIKDLNLELQKINSEKLELQNALNNIVTLDEVSKLKLKALGYEDYTLILNDLNKQNSLIPYEGVLGGSMAWRPENSFLLNHKWVYATFDDGHIDGGALLTFRVDKNKSLKWEVIDSFLNE